MPVEYLTVNHLSTKELIRAFSKIYVHPDIGFNGTLCWLWTAARTLDGYGRTEYRDMAVKVHQLMFAWTTHPLPRKQNLLQLDHLCRRPICCNPTHLEFVSARINVLRGNNVAAKNARKTECKRGHSLSGDNLFYEQGHRQCRACTRLRKRHYSKRPAVRERLRGNVARKQAIAKWREANRSHLNADARKNYHLRMRRIKEQSNDGSLEA